MRKLASRLFSYLLPKTSSSQFASDAEKKERYLTNLISLMSVCSCYPWLLTSLVKTTCMPFGRVRERGSYF